MKARLYLDVKFGKRATDAESLAAVMDKVLKTGMAAVEDCWKDYGGKPSVGKFLVLDTAQAAEHANTLEPFMNLPDEDAEKLRLIRDFLRQVAGLKR